MNLAGFAAEARQLADICTDAAGRNANGLEAAPRPRLQLASLEELASRITGALATAGGESS